MQVLPLLLSAPVPVFQHMNYNMIPISECLPVTDLLSVTFLNGYILQNSFQKLLSGSRISLHTLLQSVLYQMVVQILEQVLFLVSFNPLISWCTSASRFRRSCSS
nr:MAG TPA: hypothetical protein [Caudoviricetes sp.]